MDRRNKWIDIAQSHLLFFYKNRSLGIWRYMGCMSLKSLCFCCVCFWVTSIIEMTVLIQCLVLGFSLTWSTLTLPMKYPRILQQTAQFSVLLLLPPRGLSLELLCDALTTPYLPFCPRAPHVRNTQTAQAIIQPSWPFVKFRGQKWMQLEKPFVRTHWMARPEVTASKYTCLSHLYRARACYLLAKTCLWFSSNDNSFIRHGGLSTTWTQALFLIL